MGTLRANNGGKNWRSFLETGSYRGPTPRRKKVVDQDGNPIPEADIILDLSRRSRFDYSAWSGTADNDIKNIAQGKTDKNGEYTYEPDKDGRILVEAEKDGYSDKRVLFKQNELYKEIPKTVTLEKYPDFVPMTRDVRWNYKWTEAKEKMEIGLHFGYYWNDKRKYLPMSEEKQKSDLWFEINTHGLPDEEYENWTIKIECRNGIELHPVERGIADRKMRVAPEDGYEDIFEYKVGNLKYNNYIRFPDGRYGKIQFSVRKTSDYDYKHGKIERKIRGFYKIQEEPSNSRVIATEADYR